MAPKSLDEHIVATPGTLGGKPRITGRRISVADIVVWHELMRMSADEIADGYDLSLAEIYAALAYYCDHREEIDLGLKKDQAFAEEMRKKHPSLAQAKLAERAPDARGD